MKKETVARGRKPKNESDKVRSKGVYLTGKEWAIVEKKFGSGTKAIRKLLASV